MFKYFMFHVSCLTDVLVFLLTLLHPDESGQEQGPFTSKQMASWAAAGHLPMSLHVRQGGSCANETERGSGVLKYTSIEVLYPDGDAFVVANPAQDVREAIRALKKVVAVLEDKEEKHIRTPTKLPKNWMKDKDANGQSYYYHATSGATAWKAPPGSVGGSAGENGGSLPNASHGYKPTIMPEGWSKDVDANLDKFYVAPSGAVQWDKPPGN